MGRHLVVDDERTLEFSEDWLGPDAEVVHVRTSAEAIRELEAARDSVMRSVKGAEEIGDKVFAVAHSLPWWDTVWLDHDLGFGPDGSIGPGGEDTGMKVVDHILYNARELLPGGTRVYVHSANPPAADLMTAKLVSGGYDAERVNIRDLSPVVKVSVEGGSAW